MIEPLRSTPILPLSALRQACCPELAMKFGTLWMLWLLVGLYGDVLSDSQRRALLEYLKSL